ncbi:MAG: serine hydrolase domain-containing protein [Chitinophagia bacterium]|jgi:CubicO group peptidase (beta-lactamase class C family)
MKKLFPAIPALMLCWIAIPFQVSSQYATADSLLSALVSTSPAVGISVAVVKNNKIIYTHSAGLKNIELRQPLTYDCLFRIASISKSFSATSIMQLYEQGKLSLDQDVSELIGFPVRNPAYPEKVVTLRLMLSHRSSINDSQGYFSLDSINPSRSAQWAKCFSKYEPGTHYDYCNLNYNMIGAIIERVSGERFDQYVKHHILDPLKIYGGYNLDQLDTARLASIYEYKADSMKFVRSPGAYASRTKEIENYVLGYTTPIFSPTGGMKISAKDLAKYMIMHNRMGKTRGARILKRSSAIMMQTPANGALGYGFAIETSDNIIPGEIMKGHTGSAYGLYSAMFFHPTKKYGIVVITNGCSPGYTNGLNTVIRKTIEGLYQIVINSDNYK